MQALRGTYRPVAGTSGPRRAGRSSALRVCAVATPGQVSFNRTPSFGTNGSTATGSLQQAGGPTPVTVTYPAQIPAALSPQATYFALAAAGAAKTQGGPLRMLISGFLAGAFIAYGGYLSVSIQAGLAGIPPGLVKLVGALVFPVGLTLVVTSGAELFTGNTSVVAISKIEGKSSMGGLIHNWFWSFLGNLLGSLAMVAAVAATGTLVGNPIPIALAEAKTALPWGTAFIRAILCNWLVCMAVWNATLAQSLPGKIMGLWPPIATFVAIGLEHSVANMFFIPMGITMGAAVTWKQFFLNNLLPVTLGNTLAGVVLVAGALKLVHGLKKPDPPPAPTIVTVAHN